MFSPTPCTTKFLTIILAIGVFILIPIFFILILPLALLRYIVGKIGPYLNRDLGKILNILGSAFGGDDLYNYPASNISIMLTFEGQFDLETLRNSVQKGALEAQLGDGNLKYPEFKQCLTKYMGYYFWKNCPHFHLNNHVKIFEKCEKSQDFTAQDIQKMQKEMLSRKWTEGMPLWEIFLVPKCYPNRPVAMGLEPVPYTLICLRFHHSFGDGYSACQLLAEDLGDKKPGKGVVVKGPAKGSLWSGILSGVTFPLRTAYETSEFLLTSIFQRTFRVLEDSKMKTGQLSTVIVDRIPLQKLKEIRRHFNVSFCSVVHAVISGALRDLLIKKGTNVPNKVLGLLPLPLPSHGEKLRNQL